MRPLLVSNLPAGQTYTLRSRSKTKSARLNLPSVPSRLFPCGQVRGDLTIHKPFEQPSRAINGVACEPLGPKIKAAADAVQHGLGDGDLLFAIGARALGVEDDPGLVVDEVVCIVGEEWVDALPCDPGRLRIGQRNLLRHLAFGAPARRSTAISFAIVPITAGGVECRQVLPNRARCLLRLRPRNRRGG